MRSGDLAPKCKPRPELGVVPSTPLLCCAGPMQMAWGYEGPSRMSWTGRGQAWVCWQYPSPRAVCCLAFTGPAQVGVCHNAIADDVGAAAGVLPAACRRVLRRPQGTFSTDLTAAYQVKLLFTCNSTQAGLAPLAHPSMRYLLHLGAGHRDYSRAEGCVAGRPNCTSKMLHLIL